MPPRNLLLVATTIVVSLACYSASAKNRYANLIAEAMDVVERQSLREIPREQLFVSAMNGMIEDLDEHSMFISDEMFRNFEEDMHQEFGGVGMYVETDPKTKQLVVLAPMPGTPAFDAGIRIGDQIISIDGTMIAGFTRRKAIELLRGPIGGPVELELERGERSFKRTLVRAAINLSSVHGDYREPDGTWHFILEDHPRIGYIRLSQFGEKSANEIRSAIQNIGPIDGLILDLRNNLGGLLNVAVEISDMFLPANQVIVRTLGRNRTPLRDGQHFSTSATELDASIPVCILIDRNSASASEIVAACLQDHGRAVVVGEQSWGKGTVQNVIPIQRKKSALKLTTASYWRPSGKSIDRHDDISKQTKKWGVQPDPGFEIKLDPEQAFENIRQRSIRDFEGLIRPEDSEAFNHIQILDDDTPSSPQPTNPQEKIENETTPGPTAIPNDRSTQPHVDLPLKRAIEYIEKRAKQKQSITP